MRTTNRPNRPGLSIPCAMLAVSLFLIGCTTTQQAPPTKPGCDPKVWQQYLQQAAAKKGYIEASIAEIQLCLDCPNLAKTLGVSCAGVHVDFPPDWHEAFEGGGTPDLPGDSPEGKSLKGPLCIVKCKRVYKQCIKNCGLWTWPLPGGTANKCHDQCMKKEEQCLNSCLGK